MAGDEKFCSCEAIGHGELGPIHDEERLARIVTSPNHFRADGTLKPGAFPPTHIKNTGLSLIRADMLDESELVRHAAAVTGQKPGEELRGVLLCAAGKIRAIVDSQANRCLCAKEDPTKDQPPLPNNPAHAILIRTHNQDDPEIERIRNILIDIFGRTAAIADVYK